MEGAVVFIIHLTKDSTLFFESIMIKVGVQELAYFFFICPFRNEVIE